MNRKIFQIVFFIIVLFTFGTIIRSYLNERVSKLDDYKFFIAEIPEKSVSRLSPIVVKFSTDIDLTRLKLNVPVSSDIIRFHPEIEGYGYFTDSRTFEFQPNNPLPANSKFSASLNVAKIFRGIKLSSFRFKFSTPKLSFDVVTQPLTYFDSTGNSFVRLKGFVAFNDYVEYRKSSKVVSVLYNGKSRVVKFIPLPEKDIVQFVTEPLKRTKSNIPVILLKTGKPIGLNYSDSVVMSVVPLDSFKIVDCNFVYFPKPRLTVYFSDEIRDTSNIDSLISISDSVQYCISYNKNNISISFDSITGYTHTLRVLHNLTNTKGIMLNNDFNFNFSLSPPIPSVEFVNTGNVISKSDFDNVIPCNILNLKKVELNVYYISDKNVLQFLQVSGTDDNREIRRVGRLIYHKTVNLEDYLNYTPDELTRYNLNVVGADFDDKGIYHVSLSYKTDYIVFSDTSDVESYKADTVSRNFIFTNLSVVAKQSATDTLYIFAGNKDTNEPLRKVKAEVYNFRQEYITTLVTNKYGIAKGVVKEKDIFIKALYNDDAVYLKLTNDEGIIKDSTLLSGTVTQKGMLCSVSNLKNVYKNRDSISVGIIIKSYIGSTIKGDKLEVKLVAPDGKIIQGKVYGVSFPIVKTYSVLLPEKTMHGEWLLKIRIRDAEFEYPFKVISATGLNSIKKKEITDSLRTSSLSNLLINRYAESTVLNNGLEKDKIQIKSLSGDTLFAGDTALLSIRISHEGQSLLTIENSFGVLRYEWIKTEMGDTVYFSLSVGEEWTPGVYVNVVHFGKKRTISKIVYYPVKSNNAFNSDDFTFQMIHDWNPQKKIKLSVFNKSDEPVKYIISVIDRDITSKTYLQNYFSAKQKMLMQTWISGLHKNMNMVNAGLYSREINNVPYSSVFFQSFVIEEGSKQDITFSIPFQQNNYYVTITGISEHTQKIFTVKDSATVFLPVYIEAEVPEYMYAGDKINTSVLLQNKMPLVDTFQITINRTKNLELLYDVSKQYIIQPGQTVSADVFFHIKDIPDTATFTIEATSARVDVSRTYRLPVYASSVKAGYSTAKKIDGNSEWQYTIIPQGIKNTNRATMQVSRIQIPDIDYFMYGVDLFPQEELLSQISKIFVLLPLKDMVASQQEAKVYKKRIEKVLSELFKYQNSDGGFSNLPDTGVSDKLISNYTGWLMYIAKKHNITVNEGVYNRWVRYIKNSWRRATVLSPYKAIDNDLLMSAFIAGIINDEYVDKLIYEIENDNIDSYFRLLTLSYFNKRKAKSLLEDITDINYKELTLTDNAILFYLYKTLGVDNHSDILSVINDKLLENKFTVIEAGVSLYLVMEATLADKSVSADIKYTINHGKTLKVQDKSHIVKIAIPIEFTLPKLIDITNISEDSVYVSMFNYGISSEVKKIPHLKNIRTYSYVYNREDKNCTVFTNGDTIKQVVTIKNTSNREVKTLFSVISLPSGMDVIHSNLNRLKNVESINYKSRIELRYSILPLETIILEITYIANHRGHFTLPPVRTVQSNRLWQTAYTRSFTLIVK